MYFIFNSFKNIDYLIKKYYNGYFRVKGIFSDDVKYFI